MVQFDRVHAVIGGGSSAVSAAAQQIFAITGTPQVAHTSTAESLSDKQAFPTFSRVVAQDALQGAALARLCLRLRWNYVAVIYSSEDSYSSGM